MFCQSCGSSNSDDAKFCNQCGTTIARAGEAGGPLADKGPGETVVGVGKPVATQPTTPPVSASSTGTAPASTSSSGGYGGNPYGGASMMSVSLASIGVQSSRKVWAMVAMGAVVLIALGALGSWLFRGEPEVVTESGHAEADDPFVIGTPLPEGAVEPEVEDVDVVTGMGMTSGSMTSGMSSGTTSTMSGSTGSTMGGSTTGSTMGGSTSGSSMTGSTPTMTATGTTTMTGSTGSTGTTGTGGTDTTMETAMETAMTTTMTTTMSPTEAPEERDIELELYGSRVRYVVRRYYAARAQTCFDRATRNSPTVSGTVVVNMSIAADGTVSRATVGRNTTGDDVLGRCLMSQVSQWRLPAPPGGTLDMQMPFSR